MNLADIFNQLKRVFHRKETPMSSVPPTISTQNQQILFNAYQRLMSNRQSMIDGMKGIDSSIRRAIVVDSIISGLIAHFQDFARNESARKADIGNFAPDFPSYVQLFIDNLKIG
jgi:hypothetical protein